MDEEQGRIREPEDLDVPGMPGTSAAAAGTGRTLRRQYTPDEKRALLLEFGEAGETISAFCARHGISTASLCAWRRRHAAEGDAGLEPRPNRRNHTGHHGRRATFEERKAAVEVFLKSGVTRKT